MQLYSPIGELYCLWQFYSAEPSYIRFASFMFIGEYNITANKVSNITIACDNITASKVCNTTIYKSFTNIFVVYKRYSPSIWRERYTKEDNFERNKSRWKKTSAK